MCILILVTIISNYTNLYINGGGGGVGEANEWSWMRESFPITQYFSNFLGTLPQGRGLGPRGDRVLGDVNLMV